ncbi:MAG: calcium-binding protein [Pirellulaceae bacterium]
MSLFGPFNWLFTDEDPSNLIGKKSVRKTRNGSFKPNLQFERLEDRQLLAFMASGTNGNDAFVLTYSPSTVAITIATDGGATTPLGTFLLNEPLILDGMNGTDTVEIVGTSANDVIQVSSSAILVNGATLERFNTESLLLTGVAGNDTYRFDPAKPLGLIALNESGGGIDTLDFSPLVSSGISINLSRATSQLVHPNLQLKLNSSTTFENVIGSGGNDLITGNTLANRLSGLAGNDTIGGGAGDDAMFGGLGNDTFMFLPASSDEVDNVSESSARGHGIDTLNFSALTSGVYLNLQSTEIQFVGNNRSLKLNASATFENAIGGSGDDTLRGNILNNLLNGGNGDDELKGGSGDDLLIGGLGNDKFLFLPAATMEADRLFEGTGRGAGNDELDFQAITTTVALNLGSLGPQNVHANRTIELSSAAAFEDAFGGTGNDILTGNALANSIYGNEGNDLLTGGAGDDYLRGGYGGDSYVFASAPSTEFDIVSESGTEGDTNTLNFSQLTTAVTVNLGITETQNVHVNRTLRLFSSSFQNVIGGSANDKLIGNDYINFLAGNAGNDFLNGKSSSDVLMGGAGNDTIGGGAGLDTLMGEAGDDLLVGEDDSDVLMGGSGNDTLSGGDHNDELMGDSGNDILIGGNGLDELMGGSGRDILIGGLGADLLEGGADDDILIGGQTLPPNFQNGVDLNAVRTAWISNSDYNTRVSVLRNGPVKNSLKANLNVLNDFDARDVMTGGSGQDWFFKGNPTDVITDLFFGGPELRDLIWLNS